MPELHQSIAQHYHERTKYDPQITASKNQQGLDWTKQPVPFKEYKIGTTIDLRPYLQQEESAFANDSDSQWWQRLSKLLFCSYGLTAKIPSMGPVYLRAAPSAGGLYPAEIYIVSRGTPQLPPGLYNYQCRSHSLMHYWESEIWQRLQDACFWHPSLENTQLAIIITTVFYRSVWRYEDRAYRRIFLDSGHLIGNLELAGSVTNFRPHLIGGFVDSAVNDLLYIDPLNEGAIAVLPLADLLEVNQNLSTGCTALPSSTETDYPNIPDGELLKYFHKATEIKQTSVQNKNASEIKEEKTLSDKYHFSFCDKISIAISTPVNWGQKLEQLELTMLRRRSTRAFSGGNLTFDELKRLLDFTYQSQNYIDQSLDIAPDYFDLNLIETFIAVSGVDGLDAGCYHYEPKAQELRQIRFKNFRRELHFLCLGQELGRDASVVLFHTADLKSAVAKYGDRVYRYLHMDAGHLGQRLNLAAINIGVGVSGIGGFFDDQVNEVLGIPPAEAVLYITTLGKPR
jgi:SagB-type dehydrogenase family enzyme